MFKINFSERFKKGFEVLLVFSIIIITYLLILEFFFDTASIKDALFYVGLGVTFVFSLDLLVLYSDSPSFKHFVKSNWLDIVATIPFVMIFRYGKVLRIFRILSRSAKISKTAHLTKIPKGLKLKAQLPRMGKFLSKLSKKNKRTGK